MFLITKDFLKKISTFEQKERILDKCYNFAKQIIENEMQIRSLPKGYWVKKIKNTDIFKFRLNSGDRILFTYVNDNRDTNISVLFLDYCNHDKQVLRGNLISVESSKIKSENFQIDRNYKIDYLDSKLEKENKFINEYKNKDFVDLESLISIIVDDSYIELIVNEENEDYLYYLTKEQFNCIKDYGKPIIITGAAGSGKTTVALQKVLSQSSAEYSNIGYITYTELLADNARMCFEKFKNINYCNSNVNFYYIHQFYSKILDIPFDKIATYKTFKSTIQSFSYKSNKVLKRIDVLDIYTEFRGIIKGYLGLEANQVEILPTRKNNMLTLEEYINMPNSYSIFGEYEKMEIYKLCIKYNKKLIDLGMKDENDLAIEIIHKIRESKINLFDYIIVDEVQDLSEVQIYMLSQLVKDKDKIMFSGDIHQIINPTFFEFGRLRNIYYGLGLDTEIHTLSKNYRNPIEVIQILNRLIMDRQKYIGKTKYDYIEKGVVNGDKALVGKFKEQEIKELLKAVYQKHYCAIVVSNIEEKNKLVDLFEDAKDRIFLVNEIKGLEYENVYCINIVSSNNKEWNEIYNGESTGNSKYRYFFNLFYVAVSRATKNLFIYENNIENPVIQNIMNLTKTEEVFSKENLKIEKVSTKDDWIKESEKLKKVGNIEKARFARNKSEEDYIVNINKSLDSDFNMNYYTEIDKKNVVKDKNLVLNLINKGFKYYQNRNYSKALELYQEALKLDEDNYIIYHYIGNCFGYMSNGMIKSLEYYDWCLKLKEDYLEAHLDRAAVAKNIPGYTYNAIEKLEIAYKHNPNVVNICQLLGGLYEDLYNSCYLDGKKRQEILNNIICYYESGIKCDKALSWDTNNKYWNMDESGIQLNYLQKLCEISLQKYNSKKLIPEEVIYNIFSQANNELHSNLEDYLIYKINNARVIKNSVLYFRYFTNEILEKIKYYFETNCYPTTANAFLHDYTKIAGEARYNFERTNYTYLNKMNSNLSIMKSKSYEYQLVYYEVYCNAYIRYALIDFFDSDNTEFIKVLKSIDIEELITIIDNVIHKLTIEKLEDSFGKKIKYL